MTLLGDPAQRAANDRQAGALRRRIARWTYAVLAALGASGTAVYQCAADASCDTGVVDDQGSGECVHFNK